MSEATRSNINRRNFVRDSLYLTSAAMLAGSSTASANSLSASTPAGAQVPFTKLSPQTPINIRADAYGETCIRLSRLAAMTTRCQLDIAYGGKLAQKLDIYMPEDKSRTNLPVFINIHGGGWTHGYKEWMGLNAPAIVRFPAIYVAIEYGLLPSNPYPAPLQDCIAAVTWVYRNIASYGGDPNRIHIGGHSAGAHLAALTTFRRDLLTGSGLPENVIKACFPFSGVYDLRKLGMWGNAGRPPTGMLLDGERAGEASPVLLAKGHKTPFFVTWAENDNPLCIAQSPSFVMLLRKHGARAEGYQFPLFDHFWIHVDQQYSGNLWTRTLQGWMTGDPLTAPVPSA